MVEIRMENQQMYRWEVDFQGATLALESCTRNETPFVFTNEFTGNLVACDPRAISSIAEV